MFAIYFFCFFIFILFQFMELLIVKYFNFNARSLGDLRAPISSGLLDFVLCASWVLRTHTMAPRIQSFHQDRISGSRDRGVMEEEKKREGVGGNLEVGFPPQIKRDIF